MSDIIEHRGRVVSVDGQKVRVLIVQASACSGCSAKQSCMVAEAKEKYVDCMSVEPMQVGDEVTVEVSQSLAWEAVLLSFILPFILLMFVLCFAGMYFSEAVTGTMAICAVLFYYGAVVLFKGRLKKKFRFTARK